MKEKMFYIVNNVDFVYYMYVIYWYKIVLYKCAIIDTVLIIVSYNSVKNGNLLLYDCFICVLWPVIERWDLNKILNWNDWIAKCVEVCCYNLHIIVLFQITKLYENYEEKPNRDSEFTYFYDCSIEFWNCSDKCDIYVFILL